MKKLFFTFDCPTFVDEMVVFKEMQKMLRQFKCRMTKCGEMDKLEARMFKKMTGVCTGKAVPPKYTKIGFNED